MKYLLTKDGYTEPYHPHQNPAENHAARWLKHHAQTVMNITGLPDYVWPDCLTWIADVHNFTANEALGNRTPYEKRHGPTPDISAYILFTFWQQILYLDSNESYPNSKELPGYFLGVARNTHLHYPHMQRLTPPTQRPLPSTWSTPCWFPQSTCHS